MGAGVKGTLLKLRKDRAKYTNHKVNNTENMIPNLKWLAGRGVKYQRELRDIGKGKLTLMGISAECCISKIQL